MRNASPSSRGVYYLGWAFIRLKLGMNFGPGVGSQQAAGGGALCFSKAACPICPRMAGSLFTSTVRPHTLSTTHISVCCGPWASATATCIRPALCRLAMTPKSMGSRMRDSSEAPRERWRQGWPDQAGMDRGMGRECCCPNKWRTTAEEEGCHLHVFNIMIMWGCSTFSDVQRGH